MIASWNAPLPDGSTHAELLVRFDQGRSRRLLILPALFDEANKLRRFTVELMRRIDAAGIDCFLPDLPGCNESLAKLETLSLKNWHNAAKTSAKEVAATEVLAIRAGALLAPSNLPTWLYAPQSGAKLLQGMIRARMLAAQEAGNTETTDGLIALGSKQGLMLGGWMIGAEMLRDLAQAEPVISDNSREIVQAALGGTGLWLRAEPGYDPIQVDALAAILTAEPEQAA